METKKTYILKNEYFSYLQKIFNYQYKFFIPKKNKNLLFSQIGCVFLKKKNIPFEILNLNKINLFIFFFSIFNLRVKKNYFLNYIINYIDYVKPSVIINFMDNNINFYYINNYFPKIKTICIQNGIRGFKDDIFEVLPNKKNLSCSYFYVFNEGIKYEYSKYISSKYLVKGSYRSNEVKINNKTHKNNDICIISQFQNSKNLNNYFTNYGNRKIRWLDFLKSEDFLLNTLNEMDLDKKYSYSVYLRNSLNNKNEIMYYKKKLDKYKIKFIKYDNDQKMFNYFEKTSLVINLDSTLGYECFSRGIKTIFFTVRDDIMKHKLKFFFGWPYKLKKNGKFWTMLADKKKLIKIFNEILIMNESHWSELKNKYSFLMDRDYLNHNLIKNIKDE